MSKRLRLQGNGYTPGSVNSSDDINGNPRALVVGKATARPPRPLVVKAPPTKAPPLAKAVPVVKAKAKPTAMPKANPKAAVKPIPVLVAEAVPRKPALAPGGRKGNSAMTTCWDMDWRPETRCTDACVFTAYSFELTSDGIPHIQIYSESKKRLSGRAHTISLGLPAMRAGTKGGIASTHVCYGTQLQGLTYVGSLDGYCHKHHQGDCRGMPNAPFPFDRGYDWKATDHHQCKYRKPGAKKFSPMVDAYTHKRATDTTHFWGTRITPGSGQHRSKTQSEGADHIRVMIAAGCSFRDILLTRFAERSFNFCRLMLRYNKPDRFWHPFNVWAKGRTGVGKTQAATAVCRGECYIHATYDSRFMLGYDGHRVLVLDDMVGQIDWKRLLQYLDRHPCWVENKGGETQLTQNITIITSSMSPQQAYASHIGDAADDIEQLIRRLDVIADYDHMTSDEMLDLVDQMRDNYVRIEALRLAGPTPDPMYGEWDGVSPPPITRVVRVAQSEQASSSNGTDYTPATPMVLAIEDAPAIDIEEYDYDTDHLEEIEDFYFRPDADGVNVGNGLLPQDIVHPSEHVFSPGVTTEEEHDSDAYNSSGLYDDATDSDDTMARSTLAMGYEDDDSADSMVSL